LTLPKSNFRDFIISAASVDREEALGWGDDHALP